MIAVTADLHCYNHKPFARILKDGTNSRLNDILLCLEWMVGRALEKKCEAFVIAGDLFHSRKSIENGVLDRVCTAFHHLEAAAKGKMQIIVLAGNHDYSVTGDGSVSISAIESDHVVVVREPTGFPKLGIGFIPYMADAKAVRDAAAGFVKKTKFIIAHLGLKEGSVGPGDFEVPDSVPMDCLLPDKFKKILLGHYHRRQKIGDNILYVGSPLQLTFGEMGEEKGFTLLQDDGKTTFVKNTESPVFLETPVDALKSLERRPCDFVKVIIPPGDEVDLKKLEEENVRIEVLKPDVDVTERIPLYGKKDNEIIEEYVKANPGGEDDFNALLIQEGVKLLEESRC
jgi:DNA repair exonuclease SbcCD nuclease subunit